MKQRIPILAAAAALVVGSCSKKPDEDANASSPAKKTPSGTATVPSETPEAPQRKVRNNYAEQHWSVDEEPATDWEQKYEDAGTVEDKINVIGMKQSSGPEELAPMLRRALRHPSRRLRLEAMATTTIFINSKDEAVDIITGGVYDEDPEVRKMSMEMAREHHIETKLDIYRNTIRAPDEAVRKETAVELGRLTSKPAFEILLEGLNDPDPNFREAVNFEINLLVNQKFDSYAQAKGWWDANDTRFDERMINIIE